MNEFSNINSGQDQSTAGWDWLTAIQDMTKSGLVHSFCMPLYVLMCSNVLPLWSYEVKDFSQHQLFSFFFFVIFSMKNTKQHDFNTFRKLREEATIIVSWENWPKKEGAYPKREIGTNRLQMITNRLKKTAKNSKESEVRHRLQSLLIDYKRWQKSDSDYKVY